ncbi:MAG: LPS export ABC transporter periplasmic protein LptC [Bacteroidetes bacterium]|nr:LPS export ABC transporter periplasmic protein LptC [Bacteroidota bacterium]
MFLKKKNILHAVFLTGCIFLWACENTPQEIKDATDKKVGVEEAEKVNINYTLGGKIKSILTAPLMTHVQDTMPYIEFPKTMHVDFYSDSGKIESILDAKYGKYFETQSKILLRDSVRFIGLTNGDTLYCDELYWDRSRPVYQFYTDKAVQIRTKTQNQNGIGFECSQDFKDKWLKNVTNSFIKVPSSQFPDN